MSKKTTWKDVILKSLELEKETIAGRENIKLTILLIVFTILICLPTSIDIIANTILTLAGKDPYNVIPGRLVVFLILGTFLMTIACMWFLAYANRKSSKK